GALSAWAELRELADALGSHQPASASERAQARAWAADLGLDAERVTGLAVLAERARYGADEDIAPVDGELRDARAQLRRRAGRLRWWSALSIPAVLRRLRR
ncbi:hypothetical protein, partial [Cumulibacter manganitolerans]|uniref:hypothetical protein n=1 Tax=Cumulibacter manganitolerans TaxID=1884992 RepID=UPI00188647EE